MKRKKRTNFLVWTATTTMVVSSLGTTGNVLAVSTEEGGMENLPSQQTQQAKVATFNLFTQPEMLENYNEKFGVDRSKIKAVANGSDSSWRPENNTKLDNIFDSKLNTYWESGTGNNSRFNNDITFTFEQVENLDRIIYAPQQNEKGSGYLLEFEILGKASEGQEFVKVAEGAHTPQNLNEAIEIKFEPTDFKELKLVFKGIKSPFAAASEIMFFKQDTVYEKVSSIFKGEDYVAVNEAYDLEALKALEEEIVGHPLQENFQKTINDAKNILTVKDVEQVEAETKKFTQFDEEEIVGHPLQENFQKTINDAKNILTVKDVEQVEAETKKFTHFDHADYKNQFMVPRDEIESFKNNGGHYHVAELKNAFDGNTKTYWETNKANSANFNNEVEIAFTKLTEINRIVYGARESDRKGFITHFEIWVSPTSQGDNFELVSTGRHNKVAGLIEAKFNTVEAKRVKLVAKQSDQNWASLSELAFFKQDQDLDRVESMFVDGTQSELTAGYSTVEKIDALEKEVKGHILYEASMKMKFELARKLATKELNTEGTIFTAEQVGDRKGFIYNTLRTDIGSNLQPTGLAVKAGKTITVYVEANGATKLPTMVFSQSQGAWSNWNRSVQLSPGKNAIIVPEVPKDDKYHYDVTKGGMIYIINPYTKEQQGGAPVIRIEGADRVPFMTKDTDPTEFKQFLTEYKEKIDADKEAYPNVADREVLDVVEIVSDHVIYTGTASAAYNAYVTQGKDPKATVDGYDVWMHDTFKIHGLDDRNETHSTNLIREPIRVMQPWGFMYAAGDHTGIQTPQEGLMFGDFRVNYPGWGLNHEIGHRIDLGAREWAEVTNNMTSMAMSVVAGNIDNRIPYESIYTYVLQENKSTKWDAQGLAHRLGAFWQLELAHDGYWAELESLYRERKGGGGNDTQKQQTIIKYSSDVLKEDLSTYFEKHGFDVTEETREYTKQYGKPVKYWYLNNSVINYKGKGFTANANVDVKIVSNESAQTHTLSFAINAENKDHVLGYEIRRDGEAIGFTAGNSFTVKNVDTTKATEYQVVAYDKKLAASETADINSFKPTIHTAENVKIALRNSNFNALDYIKALDSTGKDITNSVKVKSNNVDLTKKGDYEIVYEVTSQGVTTTATMPVTVTSKVDYLSDLQEVSAKIAWNGLRKDLAPEGTKIILLRNGMPTTYAKGLGAHANSEVVYNVEGKDYDYFESYIGIDQGMAGKNSSATFKVLVDGAEVYASGVFGSGTDSQYIKVPIKEGAKTVTFITTDAGTNHNTSDHTVWADAKFTTDSSEPVISITSAATKVGEPIDILGNYTATDVEDGDLTAQVKVTGTEAVDFNQAGNYTLTYTVTDSDDHEVTATRTISVVDMKNFKHLSSYNWESENHSYSAPIKDKATSGKELRLTGENGEVVPYEKGIGAHSNSTIVYDLTDKKAAYFTSHIGVDRQMHNTIGSIEFKVIVDGVEKYTSGVMKSTDQQKYVEVDLTGAKELKLVVTDGGNGNGSDHATWGDAKLHYANEQNIADINNGTDNNTDGSDGSGNGTSPDSGNTGGSNDSSDSGNTGSSTDSPNSGNTGSSTNGSDNGNTGSSTNSPNSGNTGSSTDSPDSGNTGSSTDSPNSGNTGSSNNNPDSGNTGSSTDGSNSSNMGVSNGSPSSDNNVGTTNKPNAPESSENKFKIDLEDLDEKLKEKIDSLVIDITSKLPNGFTDGFFLSFDGDKNDINSIESVTVNKDGLFITVDNTLVKVTDQLPNTDVANGRVVRIVDDKVSTVMHYREDEDLKITSSNLQDLFVTSRVSEPFSDVDKTDWYSKDVEDIFNYAITQGTTDTTYSPSDSITRGQFATTIARALEITHRDKYDAYKLSDVEGKWYANDVQMLVELGIITGYEDGTFGGENKLTRQQAAAMVTRMLKYMNVDTTAKRNVAFGDTDNISDYAKEAVQFLATNGVFISGKDTNFNPHNNLTRAQMAKVLMQSLQLSNKLRTNR